jgi:hypothetical protein
MYEQLAMLEDLRKRYSSFVDGTSALKEEIHKFKSDIAKEVASVLARTPLTIQPRKTPTDIDSENPTCEALPPPIVPQVQLHSYFIQMYQLCGISQEFVSLTLMSVLSSCGNRRTEGGVCSYCK